MTDLMQRLVERLQELPEDEQDRYAAVYLAELDDDARWERLFRETTEAQWAKLAEQARAQEDDTVPLADFLDAL
jgi:hypothetical protein